MIEMLCRTCSNFTKNSSYSPKVPYTSTIVHTLIHTIHVYVNTYTITCTIKFWHIIALHVVIDAFN